MNVIITSWLRFELRNTDTKASNSVGTGILSSVWSGREGGDVTLSSAEVENEWSYTSSPSTCLHGVYRDNIMFHTETRTELRMPRTILFKLNQFTDWSFFTYLLLTFPILGPHSGVANLHNILSSSSFLLVVRWGVFYINIHFLPLWWNQNVGTHYQLGKGGT